MIARSTCAHPPLPKRTSVTALATPFFIAVALVLTTACQSTPKKEATVVGERGSAEGQWAGKAMVRNTRTGQNGVLSLDIIAKEPSQLRMEVTGTFGVHVASIAMNGNEVRYILSREKRFVTASAGADAFSHLVPVHIPPAALIALLFDRPLAATDWKCDRDPATNLPTFCAHKKEDVGVRWMERKDQMRRLKILSHDAEVEMVLDEARSKVQSDANTFVLTAPDGYKVEHL